MLTPEEVPLVIGWLEEYPAGVSPHAWGRTKALASYWDRATPAYAKRYG